MKYSILFLSFLLSLSSFSQKVDMSIFGEMKARSIGPAGMSGRVTCIDVIESDPSTIYVGTASGGVWKSNSGGATWEPIADTIGTLNIGSLAIQQSNPSVIWVGTGEGNPRNSQSSGFGLYRTLDGGKNWELMGLENTRNIHKVIVHPTDPNTVWVGAQGPAWGDNPNRGVYKTTDGGKTWKHVLKGDNGVGIADLVIDPNNPNKLIASMWEFRRNPWTFNSGGEGSGMFITHDGGETWVERTEKDGLPKGNLGRMGLAIAPSNSERVYALIEAEKNEVYRSDDGGFNWTSVSKDENAFNRPFYYSDIFVDPENENSVYSLWSRVSRSEDGGKTWSVIIPYYSVHPDNHAFWIHPEDPSYIILGNDGGMAISRDRADTWRHVENLPLAQYYHINVDNELPYNVYGGMQDNGSWRGPGYLWSRNGIRNVHFEGLSGGDGFDVVPDPDDANRYGYSMSQQGHVQRYDLLTGYGKDIRPTISDTIELRYNWNAPIAQDPMDNNTIYFGSQFVHKSTDKGDSWTTISPDLTTNDTSKQKQLLSGGLTFDVTGAENYTTLTSINPSRKDNKVIWVGSDDGRLSLTKDGGSTWTSLESKLPGMPKGAWIPQIHPSTHDVNEAFVVVNDYRRNNWKPFLYHTKDMGKSWKRIADSEDFPGYCLSVIQDPVEPNLVFVGTEHGLYISFDKGENWNHWNGGYPNVSTMDMKIQERESDLIIGTFGRAAYVLDNIDPLRVLCNSTVDSWKKDTLVMFSIPDAYQASNKRLGLTFTGDAYYEGENRSTGARIYTYYNSNGSDETTEGKLRVYNEQGDTIRTRKVDLKDGINYNAWWLDQKSVRQADVPKPKKDKEFGRRPVLPGIYTLEISVGENKTSQKVTVHPDPRLDVSLSDLQTRQDRFDKVEELMSKVTSMADALRENQATIKRINDLLPTEKDSIQKRMVKTGKNLDNEIQELLDQIIGKQNVKGIFRNSDILVSKVNSSLWSAWSALAGNQQAFDNYFAKAELAFNEVNKKFEAFMANGWASYKTEVGAMDFDLFRE